MHMGFIKNIYIFILIINVQIIIIHNNDASECIYQLTTIGRLDINFNGSGAFDYVYRNLNMKKTKGFKSEILRKYIVELFDVAILIYEDHMFLSPMDWCIKNISSIFSISSTAQSTNRSRCNDLLTLPGFKNKNNSMKSLKYGYFIIENQRIDDEYINDVAKGYFMYLLDNFLPMVADSNALGPKQYCINYTTSLCEEQIIKIGGMKINFDYTQAFKYAYLKFSRNNTRANNLELLRKYIDYLYNSAMSIYIDHMLLNPMDWCTKNISSILDTRALDRTIDWHCNDLLKTLPGFNYKCNAKNALLYAFYEIEHQIYKSKCMNDVLRGYFMYILNTIIPFVAGSNAYGPKQYCEKYSVLLCEEQVTMVGGIRRNFDGKKAFKHAFCKLTTHKTNTLKNVYLHQYLKYLFNEAISNYRDGMLLNPMTWCVQHMKLYFNNPVYMNLEQLCDGIFKRSGFEPREDAKKALQYAYFNIVESNAISDILTKYLSYMISTFYLYIENLSIKGPVQYCESFSSSMESITTNVPNNNVPSTQLSIDQQQPNYFDTRDTNFNWNFNPLSGSTYATGHSGAVGDDLNYDPYNTGHEIPLQNTFFDGESSTVNNKQLPIYNYEIDNFDAEGLFPGQNLDFTGLSGFTYATDNSGTKDALPEQNWDFTRLPGHPYATDNSGTKDAFLEQNWDFTRLPGYTYATDNFYTQGALPEQNSDITPSSGFPYAAVNFGDQNPQQYLYFNPSSASTSVGDQNPVFSNQLPVQSPEQFSNTPDVAFSPSLYLSTPDQNYLNDPNYKPSD